MGAPSDEDILEAMPAIAEAMSEADPVEIPIECDAEGCERAFTEEVPVGLLFGARGASTWAPHPLDGWQHSIRLDDGEHVFRCPEHKEVRDER